MWGLVGDESCDVETTGDWSASELDTPPRLARGRRSRQHMQHVCTHRGYRNHALSITSQSNMASEYTKLIYSSMYTNTHTHAHTYSAELSLTCDDPPQNVLFRRSQRLPGLGPSSACAHLSFLAYIDSNFQTSCSASWRTCDDDVIYVVITSRGRNRTNFIW